MQNNSTYRIFEDKADQLFHNRLHNRDMGPEGQDWQALEQRLNQHDSDRKNPKPPPPFRRALLALLLLLLTGAAIYTAVQVSGLGGKNIDNDYAANAATQTGSAGNHQASSTTEPPTSQNGLNAAEAPAGASTRAIGDEQPLTNSSVQQQVSGADPANSAAPAIAQPALSGSQQANAFTNRNSQMPSAAPTARAAKPVFTSIKKKERNINENTTGKNPENDGLNQNDGSRETNTTPMATQHKTDGLPDQLSVAPAASGKAVVANMPESPATTTSNQGNTTTAALPAAPPVTTKKTKEKKTRTPKEMPVHEFNNQGQWFIEGFAGFTRSTKDNQSFAAFLAPAGYFEKRLNQEKPLASLQTGVLLRYRKNHLVLGTGLSCTELGDQVKYDASYSGNVALGANGRSKLTYLEIPVTAGYEWASRRWGVSLQAGVSVGILLSAKGNYVSPTGFTSQLFNLNENKSVFRKTVFSVVVTPSVNYYLNDKSSLFVSPVYQRNLQPVTKTGAELSQKYSAMGVRFGIRTTLR